MRFRLALRRRSNASVSALVWLSRSTFVRNTHDHARGRSVGNLSGNAKQELRAEREADRVNSLAGECSFDRGLEMRGLTGVVRRFGGPVTEQVYGNHFAAGIGNEDPPSPVPASRARTKIQGRAREVSSTLAPADRNDVIVKGALSRGLQSIGRRLPVVFHRVVTHRAGGSRGLIIGPRGFSHRCRGRPLTALTRKNARSLTPRGRGQAAGVGDSRE